MSLALESSPRLAPAQPWGCHGARSFLSVGSAWLKVWFKLMICHPFSPGIIVPNDFGMV